MLGAGSSEIIDLLVRTFVAPGEEVVVAVPTFSMYESRTRVAAGGVPVIVPMRDDLTLDVPAVLGAVTERTKLIFLCSPNNPTGRRVTPGALNRLLRLGIPVAVDEAYVEFTAIIETRRDADRDVNLVVLRTFSKAYGLAGLRVGYCIAAAAVARLISRVKLPWNVSTVALAAAIAVLDDHKEFRRQREVLRSERVPAPRARRPARGVEVFESAGNFILLDIHETGVSADAVVQSLLQDGLFIRSLASHHPRRGYVRVSIGAHDENRRCVAALRKARLSTPPPPRDQRPSASYSADSADSAISRRPQRPPTASTAAGPRRTHQRVVLFELRVGAVDSPRGSAFGRRPRGVSQPLLLVGAERDPFA